MTLPQGEFLCSQPLVPLLSCQTSDDLTSTELYIKIKCAIYCKRSALLFEVTAANKSQLNKPQF